MKMDSTEGTLLYAVQMWLKYRKVDKINFDVEYADCAPEWMRWKVGLRMAGVFPRTWKVIQFLDPLARGGLAKHNYKK